MTFREYTIRVTVTQEKGHTMVSLHRAGHYETPFGPQIEVLGFTDTQVPYETMLTAIGRALVEGAPRG